jgi:NAD+ kinase
MRARSVSIQKKAYQGVEGFFQPILQPYNGAMPKAFQKVALVGKHDSQKIAGSVEHLADFLSGQGYEVVLARHATETPEQRDYPQALLTELASHADVVVVLGGDGTMLSIARALAPYPVPLIGVNQGRLGFLTDIVMSDMEAELSRMLAGEYDTEERILLSARVETDGETRFEASAFNDVVVSKAGTGRLIEFEVIIDNEFVYTQRSDGLVVATPTGSTAYALSAGGPILYPTLEAITLVPICPHTLSARPIVVSSQSRVDIILHHADDARVHFDGQSYFDLHQGDMVRICRVPYNVTLLHPKHYSYYDTLRQKLHWGKQL